MSFLGRLFGTEKAIEATVNSVSKGLDALVFTDEERERYAMRERSEARQMVVQWMSATQGQNLARRIIALSITAVWLLGIIISQIAGSVAIFMNEPANVRELSEFLVTHSADMNNAVMLILAFYFAAPHMGDIAKAVSGKFTNSINKG